jgi:hypothetical protein
MKVYDPGKFEYTHHRGYKVTANFHLFLIQAAWYKGCNFEAEADGFGQGLGTMGGDWSGIRDSSVGALEKMLEKALKFLKLIEEA